MRNEVFGLISHNKYMNQNAKSGSRILVFREILLFGLWLYIHLLPYFILWIIMYNTIGGCRDGKH